MIERKGKVEKVEIGEFDRGNSFFVTFSFGVVRQAFGGYGLGEPGSWVEKSLREELCAVCGVTEFGQIKGLNLIALYNDDFLSRIMGIKNPQTGASFLIDEWAFKTAITDRLTGGRG